MLKFRKITALLLCLVMTLAVMPVLTVAAAGTNYASAYAGVLEDLVSRYGVATHTFFNDTGERFGVLHSELIDFDGNGIPELYVLINGECDGDFPYVKYTEQIYAYNNGRAELVFETDNLEGSQGNIDLYRRDGSIYIFLRYGHDEFSYYDEDLELSEESTCTVKQFDGNKFVDVWIYNSVRATAETKSRLLQKGYTPEAGYKIYLSEYDYYYINRDTLYSNGTSISTNPEDRYTEIVDRGNRPYFVDPNMPEDDIMYMLSKQHYMMFVEVIGGELASNEHAAPNARAFIKELKGLASNMPDEAAGVTVPAYVGRYLDILKTEYKSDDFAELADFDNDGHPELVTMTQRSDEMRVRIYYPDGSGSEPLATFYSDVDDTIYNTDVDIVNNGNALYLKVGRAILDDFYDDPTRDEWSADTIFYEIDSSNGYVDYIQHYFRVNYDTVNYEIKNYNYRDFYKIPYGEETLISKAEFDRLNRKFVGGTAYEIYNSAAYDTGNGYFYDGYLHEGQPADRRIYGRQTYYTSSVELVINKLNQMAVTGTLDYLSVNDTFSRPSILITEAPFDVQPVIGVEVNGRKITSDVDPIIHNDRTLVPIRAVFEAMGAQVSWDGNTAKCILDENTVEITPDSDTFLFNGRNRSLDAPAVTEYGRIMVPIRAIAEALGGDVYWNSKTYTVEIEI
ncbi:MAG: hypothetical protein J1F63_07040 [Oscillospiraceae bacterium]|nr:hypothetical protein [Oscillospiraceae bacterium]